MSPLRAIYNLVLPVSFYLKKNILVVPFFNSETGIFLLASTSYKMYPRLTGLFIVLVVMGIFNEVYSEPISFVLTEKPIWQKPGCHRLGHSRKVSIPGCAPFTVTTNACRGFCESWAFPSLGQVHKPVTSLAQCCSIMDSEDIKLKVPCVEGERVVTLKSATSCSCYHCRKD